MKPDFRFLRNVLIKAALFFLALNLIYAAADPLPALGRLSAYNGLFPGRPRLPFGERPDKAYNFSLFSLEAMFASHEINQPKGRDEYRVLVVGDSSVWGTLLKPADTLAGQLNAAGLQVHGKAARFFNLGYPTLSLAKDLLVLDWTRRYQPDMILWLTTLEAFPRSQQLASPLLQHNAAAVRAVIQKYNLQMDPRDPALLDPDLWERTILGQRRALADLLRLQVYGAAWAASGIDQYYPESFELRANDLAADPAFHNLQPPKLQAQDLALDVLTAGMQAAAVPILLINEPVFIADGQNSDLRYNFYYPRWAYDDYRQLLRGLADQNQWNYLDAWDLVSPAEFTNTAIHLTPNGSKQLARRIAQAVLATVK